MTDTIEAQLEEMRAELRALRDEREIERLVLAYGPRVDAADSDDADRAVAAMWTEDGEYDIGGFGVRRGREEIAATYRVRHHDNVRSGIAHVMGAPVIELDGDTAVVFNYNCVFRSEDGDRWYAWRVSVNEWHFRRTADGWRVVSRVNRLVDGASDPRDIVRAAAARLRAAERAARAVKGVT